MAPSTHSRQLERLRVLGVGIAVGCLIWSTVWCVLMIFAGHWWRAALQAFFVVGDVTCLYMLRRK